MRQEVAYNIEDDQGSRHTTHPVVGSYWFILDLFASPIVWGTLSALLLSSFSRPGILDTNFTLALTIVWKPPIGGLSRVLLGYSG